MNVMYIQGKHDNILSILKTIDSEIEAVEECLSNLKEDDTLGYLALNVELQAIKKIRDLVSDTYS